MTVAEAKELAPRLMFFSVGPKRLHPLVHAFPTTARDGDVNVLALCGTLASQLGIAINSDQLCLWCQGAVETSTGSREVSP